MEPPQEGIEAVIDLLTRLAVGDYDARGTRTGTDENLDAVVVGINMLAEELGAHRSELEQRVRARTVELEAARQEAMTATRLKSQFLATMSHEIRTPMNGVIGLTELLLRTPLDDAQRQYVEGLRNAGDALLTVIDDILDFSKLEAGMVELEPIEFDPRALVEGVVGLLASTSARGELELIAHCRAEVPTRLVGDEGRLRQILLNLASNAVKFTEKGEVAVSVGVVGPDAVRPRVRFAVVDTGIGVPAHAQPGLFDSFTQADASTTRKYGGTGLGLAISRRLTEAMGGAIGLESEEGVGSTFWFEVPLPVASASPPAPVRADLAGVRALVVDDNATNRLVLASQLGEWGMRADVVEHPREVLPRMREAVGAGDPYELALLDLCMPDVDGLDLAASISGDRSLGGTSLLMLSSVTDVDPDELRRAGVRDWLAKPVRSAELRDHLVGLVGQRSAASAAGSSGSGSGSVGDRRVSPSPAAGPEPGLGRVLVVEDNEVNQVVARGLVSSLGYEVDVAEHGAEALEALAVGAYVAVLMDCHMPVMDGYRATEELRRREADGPRLPVVAMTAGATAEDRERCLAAGMDDYLTKPVGRAALRAVLERWVRPPEARPETAADAATRSRPDDATALDHQRLLVLRQLRGPQGGPLLPDLTEAFAEGLPALRIRLHRAAERGDTTARQQAAHELAGAALNLGAVRAAELARRVEDAAGSEPLGDLLEQLDEELQRAVRLLRDATRDRP